MDWTDLTSSAIAAYHHDPATGDLHVRFHSGGVYRYEGVPADVAKGLGEAESAGRFHHQNIIGRYPHHHVDAVE